MFRFVPSNQNSGGTLLLYCFVTLYTCVSCFWIIVGFCTDGMQGGVIDIPEIPADTDHIVSIAGWGEDEDGLK